MNCTITFKLLDDCKIGDADVAGLAEMHVCPMRQGFGRRVLSMLCELTDLPVVGFTDDGEVAFYEKCGYYIYDRRSECGQWVVSSVELPADAKIWSTW